MSLNVRRPLNDGHPGGYMESDKDYVLNNLELAVSLLDQYQDFLRVVCAAWDVIEHRENDYLDNTVPPYADLERALELLARGPETA